MNHDAKVVLVTTMLCAAVAFCAARLTGCQRAVETSRYEHHYSQRAVPGFGGLAWVYTDSCCCDSTRN